MCVCASTIRLVKVAERATAEIRLTCLALSEWVCAQKRVAAPSQLDASSARLQERARPAADNKFALVYLSLSLSLYPQSL